MTVSVACLSISKVKVASYVDVPEPLYENEDTVRVGDVAGCRNSTSISIELLADNKLLALIIASTVDKSLESVSTEMASTVNLSSYAPLSGERLISS